MKKWLLSSFLIATFVLYSLFTKHDNAKARVINQPTVSTNSESTPSSTSAPDNQSANGYKDGSYTGDTADAFYGNIQVKAIIQGGKITDIQFLQYPNDRINSIMINEQAMPLLKEEAITAQSASVDIVSGATDSSQAFIQSLGSALAQAK